MNTRGDLFVFEGPDGVGKTTLSKLFCEHLNLSGREARWTSFPGRGNGSIGSLIYKIHHSPQKFGVKTIRPTSLQLLHLAAHVDAIESSIRPDLERGTCIVLDRYWWSTWVYGRHAGVSRATLNAMIKLERTAWGNIVPNMIFHLSRPMPNSTRLDIELRKLYHELSCRESSTQNIIVVRNSRSLSFAKNRIFSQLK